MGTVGGGPTGEEPDVSWADVGQTSLVWLFSTDDAALARCVQDVLTEIDQSTQILAAFGNAPSPQ
jgi:hypothetical protein